MNFIIDHDPAAYFQFASQQSRVGQELMRQNGVTAAALKTIVVIEDGHCYTRSTAVLQVLRRLRGAYSLLALLGAAIPAFLRDVFYDWVAANRYRWFGRLEACRMPSPGHASRFVD